MIIETAIEQYERTKKGAVIETVETIEVGDTEVIEDTVVATAEETIDEVIEEASVEVVAETIVETKKTAKKK